MPKVMADINHRPVLIVIAGPNGSGKTTITTKVLHHEWLEDSVYINPDLVAERKFGGWNDQNAVLKAAQFCESLREKCLSERQSMIFETVLSTRSKLDFIQRAKSAGFFVRLFFVCTSSPMINAARIAGRVMTGGHDVPIAKIISRYGKSIRNCAEISQTVDRSYIYDNSVNGEDATLLFRMVDGVVVKKYVDVLPLWAQPILDT